ncbi:MAG: putative serine/threonine protein phosphatase [Gemmatimonadetes bacterium]|nr:putative serine/threonine protein phosphatase [Gemmatimonadota bacterium]
MAKDIRVSVFGRTDLGRTRDHNEDTFLVADLDAPQVLPSLTVAEQTIGPRGSLFMVADGMGGAAAGEIASSMAAQQIFEHLARVWSHDPDNRPQQFALRMREAVEYANAEIHAYAAEHPEVRGMGTTLTAAGVHGPNLFLAQVGDSRAYLIRDGVAFQLTKDQSLTQRLVDAGELTEEEAETNARRNIILQALGPDPRVKVVLSVQKLNRGDVLVVCSDGLTGLVRKTEIAAVVTSDSNLAQVCETLISLANERGGPDNITVVAARFHGDGLPEASDSEEEPQHTILRLPGSSSSSDDSLTPLPQPTPAPVPAPVPAAPREAAAVTPSANRAAIYGIAALMLAAVVWFLLR